MCSTAHALRFVSTASQSVSWSPVHVENLRKTYRYARRKPGLSGLFASDTRTIEALSGISFAIAERERVAIIGLPTAPANPPR